MKNTIVILSALALTLMVSCEKKKEFEVKVADSEMKVGKKLDVEVDNEFDPVCGMPTSDYLSDTLHYHKELWGFCSTPCKETFAKNPDEYLKDAETASQ